jgi:hypothetical protein
MQWLTKRCQRNIAFRPKLSAETQAGYLDAAAQLPRRLKFRLISRNMTPNSALLPLQSICKCES